METPTISGPSFNDEYQRLAATVTTRRETRQHRPRVTLSADGMPLVHFLRYISDSTGISVIAEQSLDEQAVSVDVKDQDVEAVLNGVARRLGVELTSNGSLYFLGSLRAEDRGVLVRRVRRLDREDLSAAIQTLLSENGRTVAFSDGMVVVGDRVAVLQRVAHLLDQVESAPAQSWVVQLYMVQARTSDFGQLGIDAVPAAELAATFAAVSNGATTTRIDASAAFEALLKAERTTDALEVVTAPLFVMMDGETAQLSDGDEVPIVTAVFNEQGDPVSQEVDYRQTGLDLAVTVRDLGTGRARLSIDLSSSDVVGFVNDQPILNSQTFKTTVAVESAGVYLVGSLDRHEASGSVKGILQSAKDWDKRKQTLQVWLRAYEVAGPAAGGERATPSEPPPAAGQGLHERDATELVESADHPQGP